MRYCTVSVEFKVNGNTYDDYNGGNGTNYYLIGRASALRRTRRCSLLGDTVAAAKYATEAATLETKLAQFWNSGSQSVQTTLTGRSLDAAISLGAVHGNKGDGVFSPHDDRILASIYQLEAGFIPEYALNQNAKSDVSGLPLSVAVGRYDGDTYDGANNSQGSRHVRPGLDQPQGDHRSAHGVGDTHMGRVKYHGAANYHCYEQYNRNTGADQGVNNLMWSYAALFDDQLRARKTLGLNDPCTSGR